MNKSKQPQINTLFRNEESEFYTKVERFTQPLRECAHEMVAFINNLDLQTPSLTALKKTYLQLESLPVKDWCQSLKTLENNLSKVEFLKKEVLLNAKNQDDFIDFFKIQNHFNAEINTLVRHTMQIAS